MLFGRRPVGKDGRPPDFLHPYTLCRPWDEYYFYYSIVSSCFENKHIFIPNCNGVKNGEILPSTQYDTYLRCNSVMENDCRESIGFYCYESSFVKFTEAGFGYSRYMGYPVRGVINI